MPKSPTECRVSEQLEESVWSVVRQENEREDQREGVGTMVRPAPLMYGAEAWALKKAQEKKVKVAEIDVQSYKAGQDKK